MEMKMKTKMNIKSECANAHTHECLHEYEHGCAYRHGSHMHHRIHIHFPTGGCTLHMYLLCICMCSPSWSSRASASQFDAHLCTSATSQQTQRRPSRMSEGRQVHEGRRRMARAPPSESHGATPRLAIARRTCTQRQHHRRCNQSSAAQGE